MKIKLLDSKGKRIGKKKKTTVKMCNVNPYYNESFVFIVEQEMLRVRILHRNKRFLPQKLPHLVLIYDTTRVIPLRSRYVDTWTSISKIRTAKAEFCGSKMSSALKEPRNSALAVLILEIDFHVSTYLLLSERTLVHTAYCVYSRNQAFAHFTMNIVSNVSKS